MHDSDMLVCKLMLLLFSSSLGELTRSAALSSVIASNAVLTASLWRRLYSLPAGHNSAAALAFELCSHR